ncbi:PAS domain-containing sensor histidine kinase [Nostoc sp. CENA543]|uniref:PAS domain S-box protein n=1 Tax=Nostoc sp. CENA543 TaxID=1869241 RepID=UPI001864FA46
MTVNHTPVTCTRKGQRVDETLKLSTPTDCPQQTITWLERIADNLPGVIFRFLCKPDGSRSVLYVSSGSQKLCELTPEVIKADWQALFNILYPEDINSFTESLSVAYATVSPWCWQGRIITPSGQLKWLDCNSHLELQANGDVLWDGLILDITDRKQAQLQLQATERRYQAILDAIPDLMFRISRDGEYLDLKGDGANVSLSRDAIIGRNLQEVLPSDVAAIGQEMIHTTLNTGNLQTCEYQLSTPLIWRDYEARLVVSGHDEVLAIVRDITERKQAESTLQNLAQKFAKAFNCSPDPITISTFQEGRYVEVNDSFVKLSGYERHEAVGRTAWELNIWVDERDRLKLIQQLQTQGAVRNLVLPFRCKSGEVITSTLSAEVMDLDGVPHIIAINHDITAQQLAAHRDRILAATLVRIRSSLNLEEILQTTVTEIRQFLQTDRVFIGIDDPKLGAKIVAESVNPQYPAVLDWKSGDDSYMQELRTIFRTHRVRTVADVSKVEISPQLRHIYQQFHTKATLALPIFVGDKLFGAVVANQCSTTRNWQPIEIDLLQQISEQLAIAIQQVKLYQELADLNASLEQQVEERTAQLQQKMQELAEMQRVKDVILHTVAHDLRTSVIGNLMVLRNLLGMAGGQGGRVQGAGGEKDDAQFPMPNTPCPIPVSSSIIERMIQGNERQLRMLDSLLEIHTCEAQGMTLQPEMVQFSHLFDRIIRDLQPLLCQNQANINNLLPANLPLVMVDISKLQKVLLNLFTHSLQHNPPGLQFTVKAKVENGMIRTCIQENGVSISKLECDRLFDLYVRDPQASCSTLISLQMYLCRQIIQAHGGEIGVISHRKRGLTFWFTLPLPV